ncbi:MAG TPA: hypothetical protein VLX11_13310 [Candidatus Acidoferrales bacterium]|nr:hypothetical protein [Candidatus Acidoferrales bacterium]
MTIDAPAEVLPDWLVPVGLAEEPTPLRREAPEPVVSALALAP